MKLAIIDLDGVVANADVRFRQAELAKEQWLMERQQGLPYANEPMTEREATDLYWRTAFTPELVPLDTLIEDVNTHLLDIQVEYGYKVVFLTSRPEDMRQATVEWLFEHTVYDGDDDLVMKPPAFQYTKTPVWKAGMIQFFISFDQVTDLLIVDDEQTHLNEITRYRMPPGVKREVCKSLSEAIAKLNGTWVEPDPFLPPEA
jgi:hypothetical protein